MAGQAEAQDIDWVVNINDTGFDPTPAGGTINYGLVIGNAGGDNAPATTVTLAIPAGATLTGVTALTGCGTLPFPGPGNVTCAVPPLASNVVLTSTVSVLTSASGTVTVVASVPTAGDSEPGNNIESETTTVIAGADLSIAITGPTSVTAGSVQTFGATVTNLGPDPATGMAVTFSAPDGLDSFTVPSFCTLDAGTYTCAIPGTLAVGEAFSFDVTGRVTAASNSDVTALANVSAGIPPDPVSDNDVATLDIEVTAGTDLRLTKTRAPVGQLLVGDEVTFTLAGFYSGDAPTNVSITDTLPANYAFVSATGTGWACSNAGQTVECLRPGGAGTGADVALPPVTITATVVSPGSPTNSASIAAEGPVDPNPGNNTANDGGATIVDPTIDLAAIKVGPNPNLTVVGNSYTFRLRARNLGTAPFFGTVELEDTLPAGLTVTSVAGAGWTCTPTPPIAGAASLFCSRVYTQGSPLNPGEATPDVVLEATATATGTQINTLTVSSPDGNLPDLNPGNDTTSVTTEGSESPDSTNLVVLKSALSPVIASGDVQTFRIEVVNEGPQPATAITLTDDLTQLRNNAVGPVDAGFIGSTVVAGSAAGLSCASAPISATGRRLTCTIDSLPVCTQGVDCPVVTVEVRPGGNPGSRTNEATAFSATVADTNPADNTGTATFEVNPTRADVTITKVGAPNPAVAGQNLVYVLTATNIDNGLSDAENVSIVDLLPKNVTFLSATPSVGSCPVTPVPGATTVAGDTVECSLGTILNGAQRTVTVVVRPNSGTRGTDLMNVATVSTTTPEIDPDNNDAQVTTPVGNPRLDLLTNKTDSIDPVAIGEDTVYTVTIRNNGPSVAENATLTDTLPAGRLAFRSVSLTGGGSCGTVPAVGAVGGTLVCSWPTLGAGQSQVMTVTMRGVAKGPALNIAAASSVETLGGFDTNPSNNTAGQTTTVRTRADMEVASKVPSVDPANLREDFTYTVTVRNNPGTGLSEADDVEVTDTLPAGMELTGTPTVAVLAGSASQTICSGAAGATAFTCTLGSVATNSLLEITVPVQIVEVTSYPQTFTNTATVTTSSLDVVPGNNSASNDMTINSSSLSGRLFRDFNDNGSADAVDTGIAGITMALSGTAFDGASVTRTATTDAAGNYTFGLIPQGDYSVTQGTISEPWLEDGTVTPGTAGGTAASATSVTGIVLPANTAATGYLFAKVPTARIGLAKRTTATTVRADGSVLVTFEMRARNFSLEPLTNVTMTDGLAGATPRAFGTHVTVLAPLTSVLDPGQYTIVTPPASTCGGANAAFDGSGDTTLLSGVTLPISTATCNVTVQMRYQPVAPQPTPASGNRWQNQARITGDGLWSGQTPATNPELDDLSTNGTNPDPGPNSNGSGTDSNTPTPVNPTFTPALTLVKTADTSGFSVPVVAGDPVEYSFTVTNSGNTVLTDVVITDPLLGGPLTAGTIPILRPGESVVQTQVYDLRADDLAARRVENQATAVGTWRLSSSGTPQTVQDLSGTEAGNNTPTVVDLGDIALVKTADRSALSIPPAPGDVVTYSFVISNLGSATLTDVTLVDLLPGLDLPVDTIPSLPGGTNATLTGTYVLTQVDIDRGFVENTATATGTFGTDGSGNPITVSDVSGATINDDTPTVVPDLQAPSIAVVKIADASGVSDPAIVGEPIAYRFEIRNTGNTTLTDVTLADDLPDLALTGSPIASLAPGDTDTLAYSATYAIKQADIDAGRVTNQASVTGSYTDPVTGTLLVADLSGATFTDDIPTEVPLAQDPGIDVVKTVDTSGLSTPAAVDDVLTYTFTVENTGNVTLTGVTITDPLPNIDLDGGPVTLAPGEIHGTEFTATYVITQADIDAGRVENQATATGGYTDPVTGPRTTEDLSGTAPGTDDPTIATIPQTPGLTLVKTADTSGVAVPPAPNDTVVYTFTVTNTGNTTLADIEVTDLLPGLSLSGGPIATLAPGATSAAVTGTYALTQADIDAGFVENQATATGLSPDPVLGPQPVTDISGTAPDNDDPTVVPDLQAPAIDIVKTVDTSALSVPPAPGDVLSYSFAITNTGNTTLTDVTVTDLLPDLALSGAPIPTLAPGATDATAWSATLVVTQDMIDGGIVSNQATATGAFVDPVTGPGTVSDLSGTAPGLDDPTEAIVGQVPGIAVVKTLDASGLSTPPVPGDVVTYAFAITNTGNITLTNVTLTDLLPNLVLDGAAIATLAPGATDDTTYSASYELTQADIDAGLVENQATATGGFTDPVTGPGTVSDLSGATLTDDTPTILDALQAPGIAVIKTADTADLSTPPAAGDPVTYAFTVINTGNTTLTGITLDDPLPNLTLTPGPIGTLAPGASDSTTFIGSYAITQADIDAGFVENQATVTGGYTDPDLGPQTTGDLSGSAETTDDPTIVTLDRTPAIAVTKSADTSTLTPGNPQPGEVITYSFVVTNTGNTTLTNITLDDPLPDLVLTGGPIATLLPGASDGTTFTATYVLTQADIDAGAIANTATATGTDAIDGPIAGSDTITTPIAQTPGIDLVKTVSLAGLSTPPVPGDALTYAFTVTNTGNVTLTGVTITDPLPNIALDGGPITLAPGEDDATTFTATYAITQDDIDAGLVINQATATGGFTDPVTGPGSVSDLSGTAFGQDDPTVATPGQNPGIAVVKTVDTSALSSPPVPGDVLTYSFEIANTGNVTLTNVTLTDPLPNLALTGDPIPFLIPGASNITAYSATYVLTQADIDAGGVTNQATATGSYVDDVTGPGTVSDLSGTSLATDDPTTAPLAQEPALTLVKTATVNTPSGIVSAPGDVILYSFEVRNTGNVTLTDITLDDPLPGLVLTVGPIAILAPGEVDATTFSASYAVVADDFVTAEIVNQATATGLFDNGGTPTPVTAISGTDTSNTDPTIVSAGTPALAFTIDITGTTDTDLDGRLSPGDLILYGFTVTNTGNVPLTNVQVDLASLFMELVPADGGTGTSTPAPLPNLVCNILTLQPGETATFTCTGAAYEVRETDAGAGSLVLNGVAEGTSPASIVVSAASAAAAVVVPPVDTGFGLVATKAVSSSSVLVGDIVRYTIAISHGTGEQLPIDIRIVDLLPEGVAYREGTARLDGVAVTPETRGSTLVFPATTLATGGTVTATFDAAILAAGGAGTRTNDAWAINSAGARVTNIASADVRLVAEPVFSCGTVLGRVFDDRNRDGIFNADGGTSEAGLPGVRLVSPNGTGVITDEFGRFTLPCEALPRAWGQPFQLKLDERTLPAGFEMTTENPLVVRLTAGTVVQMSFGATLPERLSEAATGTAGTTVAIGAATADDLTPAQRATVEASRALDALGLRVQYSGLDAQPRLNVATVDLADEAAPGSGVTFQASTNYPGWIARSELVIFDTRTRATVARLPMAPNGTMTWTAPDQDANLAYVLEVFDAQGRRDITRPRPLAIRSNPTGPAGTGPIEGFLSEDRALARGIPVSGGQVIVSGADLPPGTTVSVLGETIPVGPWRAFAVDRILPPGSHGLSIESAGQTVSQTIEIPRAEWFVTAIGTVTIGRDFNEGQIAAYAEGQLASGPRIRAMIDTDARPLDELFDGMFDPSPERILRDLDDDVPFFTTGDDSIQEDLAPTSGRLYGLIEDDTWYLSWGDFETDDILRGLARSNRTQYGAAGEWTSDALTGNGDPRVRVTGFAANARTAVQRDAIEANGGSIYFLSQRDIVKDSETVQVEIRDRISRQVLATRTLSRDVDYRLNTIQGTILLDEPIVSGASGDGIVSVPGGATITVLVVTYDFLPIGGFEGLVAGGRVEGWVSDSVRLGVEGQQDRTTAPDTTVLALDLLYQPTDTSSVLVELGQSEGPGLGLAASQNGGLTIDRFGPTGTGGTAYAQRVTGELSFGDVGLGEGFLSFFLAHEDEGFADPDGLVEFDRWRGRMAGELMVGSDTALTFGARFIDEDGGLNEADGWIGLAHDWSERAQTAFELRRVDQSGPSATVETGARTDFALRQTIEASDRLTWWIYGQATLDREGDISRDDRVGVGAEIAMYETMALATDISYGTLGWGIDIGIVESVADGHTRRFAYRLDPERRLDTGLSGPENGTLVVSGERPVSETWSQTAEVTYDIFDVEPTILNTYGVTWTPSTTWRYQFGAVSGTSVEPDGEQITRTGLSFGALRTVEYGTTLSARFEWAQNRSNEDGNPDTNTDTYAFRWISETIASDDWRFLTRLDVAFADSEVDSAIQGRFVEGDIGYAYRPAMSDDLIGLISYTYLLDEPGPDQVNIDGDDDGLGQRSHILNLSVNRRLSDYWSVNAKYGLRHRTLLARGGADLGSGIAHLGVLRFDYHLNDSWDILAEGRIMHYNGLGSEPGALFAIARDITDEVDLGVGYLWGDTPDNLRQIEPADQGFFATLTASF